MSCNPHAHFINWLQSAAIFITFVAVLMHEWIHLSNCTAEFEIKMLKIASHFLKRKIAVEILCNFFFIIIFQIFLLPVVIQCSWSMFTFWWWACWKMHESEKDMTRHCNVSVCLLWMPTSTFSSSSFVLLTLHYFIWCAYADMVVYMYNPFEVLFFVELHHKEKNNY